MTYKKFHFFYETKKPESVELADKLIAAFGQYSIADCDAVVTIGGDGGLLSGFHAAEGKPVYGITPQSSNSNGFWTDHGIDGPDSFLEHLAKVQPISLVPIRADITFDNGSTKTIYAVNEISISPQSAQAVMFDLSMIFNQRASDTHRIIADGMTFATAFGSTGTNRSYGGAVVSLGAPVIAVTGKGVCNPQGGFGSYVAIGQESVFRLSFTSTAGKRPLRFDYDGGTISRETEGAAIASAEIYLAQPGEKNMTFLCPVTPVLHGFGAIFPKR